MSFKPMTEAELSAGIAKAVADSTGNAPDPSAAVAPAVETKVEEAPAKIVPAKTEAPKEAPKVEEADSKSEEEDLDKDPHPDAEGIVKMPFRAFRTRINRATDRELMKLFQTKDRELIKSEWSKLQEWGKEREAARRAAMAAEERLKEDLQKTQAELARERRAAQAAEHARLADQQNFKLTRMAGKHIDDDYVDFALERLAKHFAALSTEEQSEFDDKKAEEWLKKFATEKPKFAKGAAIEREKDEAAAEEEAKSQAKVQPIVKPAPNVGAPVLTRPSPAPAGDSKTARPGQPNSMTRAEFTAAKRRAGISS